MNGNVAAASVAVSVILITDLSKEKEMKEATVNIKIIHKSVAGQIWCLKVHTHTHTHIDIFTSTRTH